VERIAEDFGHGMRRRDVVGNTTHGDGLATRAFHFLPTTQQSDKDTAAKPIITREQGDICKPPEERKKG